VDVMVRPSYDMIVLGDYFYDLIFTGLPEFPVLGREVNGTDVTTTGGALYITVVSLHRLGAKVGWPATFGSDYYSQSVYGFALCENLDLGLARHIDQPYRRVTSALPLHGERAFVTYTDPEALDLFDFWLKTLESCDFKHLHFGGLEHFKAMQPLVDYARSRGATISADCQDGPHLQDPCICQETLAKMDIFMPNAREACIVAETDDVEAALRHLAMLVNIVVIKDGAHGAWVARGDEMIHVPVIQAGKVVDTTGAGDCFNAGFLYGYISEGAPLDACARYGTICGGLSVTGIGGATAAPTRVELDVWMVREFAR
jgi:sugar/nucleoside kinase (ribokinase family)